MWVKTMQELFVISVNLKLFQIRRTESTIQEQNSISLGGKQVV